jgi:hypothetical protein
MARAQFESRPLTLHKSIPPCHSKIWMHIAAILARVFSPAARRQCPKLHKIPMIPMRLKRNPMANPVKSKNSTDNQIIQTSRRPHKKPRSAAVLLLVLQTMMLLGHQIRKTSCHNAMSFSGQSATSAASSALTFNGSLLHHGTKIMLSKRITKERLPELWQSLCTMPGWLSPSDTTPVLFLIFVSKQ